MSFVNIITAAEIEHKINTTAKVVFLVIIYIIVSITPAIIVTMIDLTSSSFPNPSNISALVFRPRGIYRSLLCFNI